MDWNITITVPGVVGAVVFDICTKADYEKMAARGFTGCGKILRRYCADPDGWDITPKFEQDRIAQKYAQDIENLVEELGKILKIPESRLLHDPEMPDNLMPSHTIGEKIVFDYTGIDFLRQQDMNYLEWRQYLADGAKYNIARDKDGVELLNQVYDDMFVPFDRNDFLRGK